MPQAATWQTAVPGRAVLASHQVEYSLLNRRAEDEVVPAARGAQDGPAAMVATGPRRADRQVPHRHAGRLPGRVPAFRELRDAYLDERCNRIVEAVVRAADGLDWSPLEVALAWVRDRPA